MASEQVPDSPKRPTNFQEVLEKAKREGNYRILSEEDMFGGPEGLAAFKDAMRKVHEDYCRMANASVAACRNKFLRGTLTCVNRY